MTAFILKIIASLCMLIDHIGEVFPSPEFFRWIGRIAFPIYAYMIAQGCKHTKNINKYLLRLGIFALISEVPFDIAFKHYIMDEGVNLNINFFDETNIFYTLFLGVACIVVYENVKKKQRPMFVLMPILIIPVTLLPAFILQESWQIKMVLSLGFLLHLAAVLWLCHSLQEVEADTETALPRKILALIPTVPIILLGSIMNTDYGMWAIIYIMFFYFMNPENRITRTIAMFSVVFLKYGYPYIYSLCYQKGIRLFTLPGEMILFTNNLYNFGFALVAVVLVFLYNGNQGPKVKWAFYAFYPVHIAVLAAIWLIVRV